MHREGRGALGDGEREREGVIRTFRGGTFGGGARSGAERARDPWAPDAAGSGGTWRCGFVQLFPPSGFGAWEVRGPGPAGLGLFRVTAAAGVAGGTQGGD